MTFEYNSGYKNPLTPKEFSDAAESLQGQLVRRVNARVSLVRLSGRKPVDSIFSDTTEQPVAFIAHDVGGLVVMKVKIVSIASMLKVMNSQS